MALQTSGAISLANIASEFGGSAPHSLSEYYGAASGIPASGQISIGNFYGATALADLTLPPINEAFENAKNGYFRHGRGIPNGSGQSINLTFPGGTVRTRQGPLTLTHYHVDRVTSGGFTSFTLNIYKPDAEAAGLIGNKLFDDGPYPAHDVNPANFGYTSVKISLGSNSYTQSMASTRTTPQDGSVGSYSIQRFTGISSDTNYDSWRFVLVFPSNLTWLNTNTAGLVVTFLP